MTDADAKAPAPDAASVAPPSAASQRITNSLAQRIIAAKRLVEAGETSAGAGAGKNDPPSPAASTAPTKAEPLPAYVPRSQAGSSTAAVGGMSYPVMARVLPVAVGVVVGVCIGLFSSWFHPQQTRLVSLAGAPFVLYFCFKTAPPATAAATSARGAGVVALVAAGARLTSAQLQALIGDRNVSVTVKRKALSDEYSAVAEQYVKYGLAVGFVLALGWQFLDVVGVHAWWTAHGDAVVAGLTRSVSGPQALQLALLGAGVMYVLHRRRAASAAYLTSKLEASVQNAAGAGAGDAAAVADRDATAGTNLAAVAGAGAVGDEASASSTSRRKGKRK